MLSKLNPNWLREPLIHFIFLGVILFVGNYFWEKAVASNSYKIEVTQSEIARMAEKFRAETLRTPEQIDIEALLASYIEEEALFREALRLGLDNGDTIIRRRLAQKMRFILQKDHTLISPSEQELREWFTENSNRFTQPESRSFSHIFFLQKPENISVVLNNISHENWLQLGDAFIEDRTIRRAQRQLVESKFGVEFSDKIFSIDETNLWSGPHPSALGWHLVRIDDVIDKVIPDFEDVSEKVKSAWEEDRIRLTNEKKLSDLINQYDITVQGSSN